MRLVWWLLMPAIAVLATAAEARPRDDALSGAFRCAGIADSRQWLDCYYGAAQPVRASLGLPPALAAQLKLAASPPGGGQPQNEAVRDEVMSAAANCIRVGADRSWLDCYYAAATPMRAQLGLPVPQGALKPAPAPQMTYVSPPPPAAAKPSGPPPMPRNTGLLNGLFNETKPIVRSMPMQSYTQDQNGAFTVVLEDGQVWKQANEDEIYHPVRWKKPAAQMLVTIAPGVMHTFNLTVAGESRVYKVRRIK